THSPYARPMLDVQESAHRNPAAQGAYPGAQSEEKFEQFPAHQGGRSQFDGQEVLVEPGAGLGVQVPVPVKQDQVGRQGPQQAQENSFQNEGPADKPVGGADKFHNADLPAPGKNGELNGIGNQKQRHNGQDCNDAHAEQPQYPG